MRNLILTLFVCSYLSSCVFIRTDDSIDLGNQYRYIQDTPRTIIYHKNSDYNGVGKEIIPPVVISYSFNDQYIIAKSQEVDLMTGDKNYYYYYYYYWLINKSTKGSLVKPLDSITFYLKLNELNINLKLNK